MQTTLCRKICAPVGFKTGKTVSVAGLQRPRVKTQLGLPSEASSCHLVKFTEVRGCYEEGRGVGFGMAGLVLAILGRPPRCECFTCRWLVAAL